MHVCSKIPYRTQWQAEVVLCRLRGLNAARGRKCLTGSYLCSACKAWHLTSKSRSQTPPWAR